VTRERQPNAPATNLLTEVLGGEAGNELRVFVGFDEWLRERVSGQQ
jgi:hypothetical protein